MIEMLEQVRKDHEHSQRVTADKLGVSKSTYARWETGERIIPLNHLNQFCNFYDVSMDYLIGISKKKNYSNIKIKNIDVNIVAKRLKQIRQEKGLSQLNFANTLNTTQSTICSYENANTLIITLFASEICKQNNISLDWLCGRVNDRNPK